MLAHQYFERKKVQQGNTLCVQLRRFQQSHLLLCGSEVAWSNSAVDVQLRWHTAKPAVEVPLLPDSLPAALAGWPRLCFVWWWIR